MPRPLSPFRRARHRHSVGNGTNDLLELIRYEVLLRMRRVQSKGVLDPAPCPMVPWGSADLDRSSSEGVCHLYTALGCPAMGLVEVRLGLGWLLLDVCSKTSPGT